MASLNVTYISMFQLDQGMDRAAHYQYGCEFLEFWTLFKLLQTGNSQLSCPTRHGFDGVVECRQRRVEIASQQDVVKPDDGERLRQLSCALTQVGHHACRHHIIESQYRSDFWTLCKQLCSGLLPPQVQ